jgi:hypothetical protein
MKKAAEAAPDEPIPPVPEYKAPPPSGKTCEACKATLETCVCPAWGTRELDIRKQLPRTELITKMQAFLKNCQSVESYGEELRKLCAELAKYGTHLLAQEKLLSAARGSGMPNEKILAQHTAAITKWIAVCDEHVGMMIGQEMDMSFLRGQSKMLEWKYLAPNGHPVLPIPDKEPEKEAGAVSSST